MANSGTGLIIAILILIGMLLLCHTMNFLYPRTINTFNNIPSITKPLPTQYNIITYDNNLGKIPCNNQAQIPCNIQKQCTKSQLSDSELAILYKEAYEMAGEEVLLRTLREMQSPTTTKAT